MQPLAQESDLPVESYAIFSPVLGTLQAFPHASQAPAGPRLPAPCAPSPDPPVHPGADPLPSTALDPQINHGCHHLPSHGEESVGCSENWVGQGHQEVQGQVTEKKCHSNGTLKGQPMCCLQGSRGGIGEARQNRKLSSHVELQAGWE